MYRLEQIALLSALTVLSAASQTKTEPDTLGQKREERSYAMPEFVVTATRWQINAEYLPSSATVLSAADLSATNGSSLASALEGTPGLFLKSYGGPGAVSTTSLRGMGAEHTLILIDGQRYNNVRDGQVDFGTFLLQNVDRVEVLRGGFSSIYGADAVGGIINIITRRPGNELEVKGEFSAGSYGMNSQHFSAGFRLGKVGLLVGAEREAGLGNYAFDFNDGISSTVLHRQNADYALNQFQLMADIPLRHDLTIRLSNTYNLSDRGSPGAVLSPTSGNKARLRDSGLLTQATLEWTAASALSVRLSSLFNAQRRQYADPLAGGGPDDQETDFADKTVTFTPHLRYVLNSWTSVNLGGEYSHSLISSSQIVSAGRSQGSVFLSTDHVIEFPRDVLYQLDLYPSIRYDHFSDVAGSLDPKIGMNIGLWRSPSLRFKSSYGKSFRAPTFYDLYWKNGGNPALRPERSLSFDAGLSVSSDFLGPFELEANYFDIRTNDRIVWTPDQNGFWSPKNLQEVRSSGVELIASYRLMRDRLVVRADYSNSDTRKTSGNSPDDETVNKQLPYIPHEMAGLTVSLNLGRAVVNVHHTFTGFRFSTETNDPQFVLSGYNKTDANMSVRISEEPIVADVRIEVSNLFNSDYQLFPNFPMPLRSFAVKMTVEY